MLDFLKIKITDVNTIKYFKEHPSIYFHSENERLLNDKETLNSKEIRQYKGILFEFVCDTLYIKFKPHYYFNKGLHNANDFNIYNCIAIIFEFTQLFKVNLKHLNIINIEFGLNIIIPVSLIDIKDLLVYLIYHERNSFYTLKNLPYCRFSTTVNSNGKANVYKAIKAYAKGIQFPEYTDTNTFRFEVKSNRKTYINKLGIYTLEDLFKIETYQILSNNILKEFDKVLIIDETVTPNISNHKLTNFKKQLNPLYWYKCFLKSRNVFNNSFKNYYKSLDTCETHLKKEIRKLIFNKLQELKKCADLTIYKGEICTDLKYKCLVTGLNISMQKSDSILLSHTGLKYYYNTDKKIFDEVKYKYLSTKWIESDYKTQIKEIAHNIRNAHSNQQIKQQRIYQPQQLQLFDITI